MFEVAFPGKTLVNAFTILLQPFFKSPPEAGDNLAAD
jgi:hypothetical protein